MLARVLDMCGSWPDYCRCDGSVDKNITSILAFLKLLNSFDGEFAQIPFCLLHIICSNWSKTCWSRQKLENRMLITFISNELINSLRNESIQYFINNSIGTRIVSGCTTYIVQNVFAGDYFHICIATLRY